ncbi:MAG: acyltransferase, partial [Haloglomus sp.]
MSIRSDPLDRLQIPDGTTVEEHDLVANGDVVVGGQSTVEFGVRGRNVYAGERVRFDGDIEADGECRLDVWCDVSGNVLVGGDAYLGERVHVAGQLIVSGDLDIGDDVDIEEGFEA